MLITVDLDVLAWCLCCFRLLWLYVDFFSLNTLVMPFIVYYVWWFSFGLLSLMICLRLVVAGSFCLGADFLVCLLMLWVLVDLFVYCYICVGFVVLYLFFCWFILFLRFDAFVDLLLIALIFLLFVVFMTLRFDLLCFCIGFVIILFLNLF